MATPLYSYLPPFYFVIIDFESQFFFFLHLLISIISTTSSVKICIGSVPNIFLSMDQTSESMVVKYRHFNVYFDII